MTLVCNPPNSDVPHLSAPVGAIIHAAAASAGLVGAGLAQLPGADAPVLVGIQTLMIAAVARQHGTPLDEAAATHLLLTFSATNAGRGLSQWVIGWIPGYGNAINAATATALTEAIGWAADAHFQNVRQTA